MTPRARHLTDREAAARERRKATMLDVLAFDQAKLVWSLLSDPERRFMPIVYHALLATPDKRIPPLDYFD